MSLCFSKLVLACNLCWRQFFDFTMIPSLCSTVTITQITSSRMAVFTPRFLLNTNGQSNVTSILPQPCCLDVLGYLYCIITLVFAVSRPEFLSLWYCCILSAVCRVGWHLFVLCTGMACLDGHELDRLDTTSGCCSECSHLSANWSMSVLCLLQYWIGAVIALGATLACVDMHFFQVQVHVMCFIQVWWRSVSSSIRMTQ